jgi:CRISPR-associated endonuclease/helicase Cas3
LQFIAFILVNRSAACGCPGGNEISIDILVQSNGKQSYIDSVIGAKFVALDSIIVLHNTTIKYHGHKAVEQISEMDKHFVQIVMRKNVMKNGVKSEKLEVISMPNIYDNWGKYNSDDNYHLLVYHSLDVAAVGRVILQHNQILLDRFSAIMKLDKETTLDTITFLLAIHDLGKFSESFQNQKSELCTQLRGKQCTMPYPYKHDRLGFFIMHKIWSQIQNIFVCDDAERVNMRQTIKPLCESIFGHHGEPVQAINYNAKLASSADIAQATEFITTIYTMFNKPQFIKYENIQAYKEVSWLLAGLVVECDWIGSSAAFNHTYIPLDIYWQQAIEFAQAKIQEQGRTSIVASKQTGVEAIYPEILATQSPMQEYVSTCSLNATPQLFIIEDMTGSGKTEAAMVLSHRLMSLGLANGIFIALPTMATSNAMYDRLSKIYRKFFTSNSTPSLMLKHSGSYLNQRFCRTIVKSNDSSYYNADEKTVTAQCNEWFTENGKKALLADVGVGTIDQALMAILPTRHQSLRVCGLADKILVVDEVHSYDEYMNTLLCNLLQLQAMLGGSVILLSATLTKALRQRLIDSYYKGLKCKNKYINSTAYPLITHVQADKLEEVAIRHRDGTARSIEVGIITNIDIVVKSVVERIARGECVCWIRNTVNDVHTAYEMLSQYIPVDKIRIFHARFIMSDRLKIERQIISQFGKPRDNELLTDKMHGRQGYVVLATQVVEQSLDVDFDYEISDLAPIDVLIQRFGRMQRHMIFGAERLPHVDVFAPVLTSDPGTNWYRKDFRGASFVYEAHGKLYLTEKILLNRQHINIPGDLREVIEYVYDSNAIIPPALQQIEDRVLGDVYADRSCANINRLVLDAGYTYSLDIWQENTPTRLDIEGMILILAKWDGERLTPLADDLGFDNYRWSMSQVGVQRHKVSDWKSTNLKLNNAIEVVKETMMRGNQQYLLIPGVQNNGVWQNIGTITNDRGSCVFLTYNYTQGLIINSEREQLLYSALHNND